MNHTQHTTPLAPHALWSIQLAHPASGPPLAVDNLLLIPTQESGPSSHDAQLHALGLADGSARWQKPFEYALVSGLAQPCEGSEPSQGFILIATTSTDLMRGEGALVALDAAGEERWRWAPGVQRVSAPVVVRSDDFSRSDEEATEVATTNLDRGLMDTVCITADARTLLLLDLATGEERARVTLEATASLSAPALAGDAVYVPCRDPHLLAVGLNGRPRWRFDADASPNVWLDKTPVVVREHLFAVLSTGAALALRAEDGSLGWRENVGPVGKPLSAPAADGERLFVGARDGLHALDLADGREIWFFHTERRIAAAPVVVGGAVYVTCHDHHLYALDAATGRELWRYEVGRRIEVSPALATCGEPPTPCVLVADRGGTLTAVARPLSAEEHEAAGHWVEAASAYASLGQFSRGAELLEAHGEPLRAAELWEAAGERERAAAQYEASGTWQRAAELWAGLGHPLKQAEALEARARSLEDTTCSGEERAAAWEAAAVAFEAEGELERAVACRREVTRWSQQPVITLDVKHDGLVLHTWTRLQFTVRNEGYGPARNMVIRASGDEFEGQVMTTHRIITLRAGQERTQWLDVRPLEHGETVPLRVSVEYQDQAGELHSCEHNIYMEVARTQAMRGVGETIGVLGSSKGAETQRERELASLRRQLGEAHENLRLIEERKSQYVLEVNVPLQLIKEERGLRERIAELERALSEAVHQEGNDR